MRPIVMTALSVALLLSCGDPPRGRDDQGGVNAGGSGGGGRFQLEEYCNDVAGAACFLARKCGNGTLFGDRHATNGECLRAVSATCRASGLSIERSIDGAALVYDAVALRSCLDHLGSSDCTEAVEAWGLLSCDAVQGSRKCDRFFFETSPHDACTAVFTGAVPLAEVCYQDAECAEGWCNEFAGALCPGSCQPALQLGDRCASLREACAPPLVCAGIARKRCVPAALEDGECMTLSGEAWPTCGAPMMCVSDSGCAPGRVCARCVSLVPKDGACGDFRARCEPDSYCDFKADNTAEGVCRPFKEEDAECNDALGSPRPCGNALHCFGPGVDPGNPGRPGTRGKCRPYPTNTDAGAEACVRHDSNCVDAYCTAGGPKWEGFCMPLAELGEQCSRNSECGSRQCAPEGAGGSYLCVSPESRVEQTTCLRPEPGAEE